MKNQLLIWEQYDDLIEHKFVIDEVDLDAYIREFCNNFILKETKNRPHSTITFVDKTVSESLYPEINIALKFMCKSPTMIESIFYAHFNYIHIDSIKKFEKKSERLVILEQVDATGKPTGPPLSFDYNELGYEDGRRKPEEYPPGEEPMRKVRYKLTMGDYTYMMSRNGALIDTISPKESF